MNKKEALIQVLLNHAPPGSEIFPGQTFDDLGIESMGLFQIALEIEEYFGEEMKEDDLERILCCQSLDDLFCVVEDFALNSNTKPADGADQSPNGDVDAEQIVENEIIKLVGACWVSRALHAAIILRLPDALGDRTLSLQELCENAQADVSIVRAVIQILAERDIFTLKDGIVGQTMASQALRSDHHAGLVDFVDWMTSDEIWDSLKHLPAAARSGSSGFAAAHGGTLFAYLRQNPDKSALFNRHMARFTRKEAEAILDSVCLAQFSTIADIGAGEGVLASRISQNYPAAQVTAFDLPGTGFSALEGNGSVACLHGDFFVDPLPQADLTILCSILHDWDDENAEKIMQAVSRSAAPEGHLFLIEGLADSEEEKVKIVDLGMAVMTGGRQRSRKEYESLLARHGFAIYGVAQCTRHLSVLKAHRTALTAV